MKKLRKTGLVDELRTDFVDHKTFSIANAYSGMISRILALPMLVGFWPGTVRGSGVGVADGVTDISGNLIHLSRTNSPFAYSSNVTPWLPYNHFNGTSSVLARADNANLSVTGADTGVDIGSLGGLTVGCWARTTVSGVSNQAIMSKWQPGGNQRSWLLYANLSGKITFNITTDGSTQIAWSSTASHPVSEWMFVVGRFKPSTSLDVWLNDTYDRRVSGIPATIFDSTAPFNIGATNSAADWFGGGQMNMWWMCASFVPDIIIRSLFEWSRPLYGV